MIRIATAAALAIWAGSAGAQVVNDYPTNARADYVFVCMATNGQNREVLRKCACSIDTIATILPYEKYVEAETVLALPPVINMKNTMASGALKN